MVLQVSSSAPCLTVPFESDVSLVDVYMRRIEKPSTYRTKRPRLADFYKYPQHGGKSYPSGMAVIVQLWDLFTDSYRNIFNNMVTLHVSTVQRLSTREE